MINIILISGFLGSGKTTMLNQMIKNMKHLAIIVNEYGKESVDDKLLETDYSVSEISNGSIFCTCKSDQFVNVLLKAKDHDIKTIIVENSGLADPMGMASIMEILDKVSPNTFKYGGSICLVDAKNYHKVKSTLPVIKNQLLGSSLIVINKSDLVDSIYLESLKEELEHFGHQVISTEYGKINYNALPELVSENNKNHLISMTLGITKLHLDTSNKTKKDVEEWLDDISHLTLRIKGFLKDEEFYLIQSVLHDYNIKKWHRSESLFLEVIMKSNDVNKEKIIKVWENR